MILRIKVLTYNGAYTPVQYSTLNNFSITVNGAILPIISEGTGLTAGLTARINIVSEIDANNIVIVNIDNAGSTYSQSFVVFGYDTTLDIVLHTSTTVVGNSIIAYREPYTDNIYIYNGVADSTSTFNNVTANSSIINSAEEYTITQLNTRGTYTNSTNKLISTFKDRINYSQFVNVQNSLLSPNITSNVDIGVQIPFADLDKKLIDDSSSYTSTKYVISHREIDPLGVEINSLISTVLNADYLTYLANTNLLSFVPQLIGDYTASTTVDVYNDSTIIKSDTLNTNIQARQFFTYTDSTITNLALPTNVTDGTIYIDIDGLAEPIGGNTAFTDSISTNTPIASGATITVSLPQDGVYRVTARRPLVANPGTDYTNSSEWQVVTAILLRYVDMTNCYTKLIKTLICDDCTDCIEPLNTDFNRIKSVIELFELHINAFNIKHKQTNVDYSFDFVYSILDSEDLVNLYTMQQVIDRAKDYCGTCEPKFINAGKCGCS